MKPLEHVRTLREGLFCVFWNVCEGSALGASRRWSGRGGTRWIIVSIAIFLLLGICFHKQSCVDFACLFSGALSPWGSRGLLSALRPGSAGLCWSLFSGQAKIYGPSNLPMPPKALGRSQPEATSLGSGTVRLSWSAPWSSWEVAWTDLVHQTKHLIEIIKSRKRTEKQQKKKGRADGGEGSRLRGVRGEGGDG